MDPDPQPCLSFMHCFAVFERKYSAHLTIVCPVLFTSLYICNMYNRSVGWECDNPHHSTAAAAHASLLPPLRLHPVRQGEQQGARQGRADIRQEPHAQEQAARAAAEQCAHS